MENNFQQLQSQVRMLQSQVDALTQILKNHNHADTQTVSINLKNIRDLFQTVTDASGATTNRDLKLAVPPRSLYEQIFYWTDVPNGGSVKKLYIYDSSNTSSTYSNGWHYITMT